MNEQTLGQIACPVCGEGCALKLTKKGKAYCNCTGCGSQTFARSVVSDGKLRARLKQIEQQAAQPEQGLVAAGQTRYEKHREIAEKPAVTVTKHTSDGQTERTIFDILGSIGK